jgi:putative DNA primase/helicase
MRSPDVTTAVHEGQQSMLDYIAPFVEAGLAVHWLHPRTKRPIGEGWTEKPIWSLAALRTRYATGNNVGFRPGEPSRVDGHYVHVIDMDIRRPELASEAMAALRGAIPNVESLPTVQSGSGGESRHFYFLTAEPHGTIKIARSGGSFSDAKDKKHWDWEIEVLGTGRNVVLPPSIHPDTGEPYRWLRPFDFDLIEMGVGPVIDADVIANWAPDPAAGPAADSDDDDLAALVRGEPLGLSDQEIGSTLAGLPLPDWCDDRDGWLKVGMALHHETGGSDAGLGKWLTFSRQCPAKFDESDTRRAWRRFASDRAGRVTFRTLLKAAPPAKPLPSGPGGDIHWGREFASRHRGQFLSVIPGRTWRRWEGAHWAACSQGQEVEAAKIFAGEVMLEAAKAYFASETDLNKSLQKDATALFRTARRLESMLKMAATERGIVVAPDAFDANPWLLGVQNGVLCLKTGLLIPPSPDQMVARQSKASFDPNATAPRWEGFLDRVQPDPAVRAFLARAVGYTLTGSVDEERLFFLVGIGANGKSVFGNVIEALLGEFAQAVGSKLLIKSHNANEADRLVPRLVGARLAQANETGQGDIWDDQRIKELASRERISTRELYGSAFSFMPTHKLWIRGNHLPGVHDAGDGFWRRLVPIPFDVQIPPSERVGDLDRQIIANELSGVLNWALAGCLEWRVSGLAVPAVLAREIDSYRQETDLLGSWLAENVESDPAARLPIADAFEDFCAYCQAQRLTPPSMPSFSRQMGARNLRTAGSRKGGRKIPGIRLRSSGFDTLDDIG